MNIVYGAGNRLGAGYQLFDFLQHTQHDVKVAGYSSLSQLITHFHWTLDPITHWPELLSKLHEDISASEPDLIISDGEPIVANLAKKLGVPLVKCSPLHLLDGVQWKVGQQKYQTTLRPLRRMLATIPAGDINLVYAPYGMTEVHLREGFEWIKPYSISTSKGSEILAVVEDKNRYVSLGKVLQNIEIIQRHDPKYLEALSQSRLVITSGESSVISDLIASQISFVVIPDVKEPENVLNALVSSNCMLGENLGQLELLGHVGVDDLEKAIERADSYFTTKIVGKLLHERIDEIWDLT